MMLHCSECLGHSKAARCGVCDGKFGLCRYYAWRTPLCSKKCVERFKARQENDRNWLIPNGPSEYQNSKFFGDTCIK